MKSMGITTSALNLLRNLDYDRFDVTAYWVHGRGPDRLKNARLVDPRVRVIPRAAVLNGSPRRVRAEQRRMLRTGLEETSPREHTAFWTDEWRRMFGDATFDHLVDFSGYGCFSPFLFTVADAKHKSIWLHNDMMADMQRETIGEKHLEQRLMAVFSTYQHFDHLVSVSPTLDTVNREKLAALRTARAVHLRAQHHRRRAGAADGVDDPGAGAGEGRRCSRSRRRSPAQQVSSTPRTSHPRWPACWSTSTPRTCSARSAAGTGSRGAPTPGPARSRS